LDIYIPDGDIHTRRPTFFFVHGGGYAWGDKFEGDPIAEGNGDSKSPDYLLSVAQNGYNVVSINTD
jgi:acetyl esterase/lipase